MAPPNYFLEYERVRGQSLADFARTLRAKPKKPVGQVTIAELCSVHEYPNGLYFFFDEDDVLKYVGKSSSRAFVERVPSHFDPRFEAWFNTLPKKLMQYDGFDEYLAAHSRALELRIVLLGVKERTTVNSLETRLRCHLQPSLNAGKVGRFAASSLLLECEA
jgi:hypothetical protein